jgi:hypothetical protein
MLAAIRPRRFNFNVIEFSSLVGLVFFASLVEAVESRFAGFGPVVYEECRARASYVVASTDLAAERESVL